MPKKPKKTSQKVDSQELFYHATRILSADWHLRHALPPQTDKLMVAQGSMILNAFASELFIKCILLIEGKTPPPTHKLDVLFRQVGHKTKRNIEAIWDAQARPKLTHMSVNHGHPLDLPNAIVTCANSFERLRYHYEDPSKTFFYIGELPEILHRIILEIKPEWDLPTQSTSQPQKTQTPPAEAP